MSHTFKSRSTSVVKGFVQSVLFVDDQAFLADDGDHPFDANLIAKESAKRGLLSASFAPVVAGDSKLAVDLGQKADVVVLDWRMVLSDAKDVVETVEDEEEDDDTVDARGDFAVETIKGLLYDADETTQVPQLKLVFIFTGEPGLDRIFERLCRDFPSLTRVDDFTLMCDGVRISIWAKPVTRIRFRHMPENRARICSYAQLLDKIFVEYTELSSGLMSNAGLSALTAIRKNTYKLLNQFSPDLDAAYISHRILSDPVEDAEGQVVQLIASQIFSILEECQVSSTLNASSIKAWMDNSSSANSRYRSKARISGSEQHAKDELFKLICDGVSGTRIDRTNKIFSEIIERLKDGVSKNEISFLTDVFSSDTRSGIEQDRLFSHLFGFKDLLTASPPMLEPGTIIQNNSGSYFVCIQPGCDCLRIPSSGRKFLFLPLKKNDHCHHISIPLTDDILNLKVADRAYQIETLKFKPIKNGGSILALKSDDGWSFSSTSKDTGTLFRWIGTLRKELSLRIAHGVGQNVTRIGLDESEWQRRWAK